MSPIMTNRQHPLHIASGARAAVSAVVSLIGKVVSQKQEGLMSTRDIRLSELAPPTFALTLNLATYGSKDEHAQMTAHELDMNQPAVRAVPTLQGCKAKKSPPPAVATSAGVGRSSYVVILTWCFTFFNTMRTLAYLPTVMTIVQHGDSSQHSLFTWLTWLGANITMAAWLYEQNGAKLNRAVAVNVANSAMCLTTVAVIVAFRP